jgi:hypothetical protein
MEREGMVLFFCVAGNALAAKPYFCGLSQISGYSPPKFVEH